MKKIVRVCLDCMESYSLHFNCDKPQRKLDGYHKLNELATVSILIMGQQVRYHDRNFLLILSIHKEFMHVSQIKLRSKS